MLVLQFQKLVDGGTKELTGSHPPGLLALLHQQVCMAKEKCIFVICLNRFPDKLGGIGRRKVNKLSVCMTMIS